MKTILAKDAEVNVLYHIPSRYGVFFIRPKNKKTYGRDEMKSVYFYEIDFYYEGAKLVTSSLYFNDVVVEASRQHYKLLMDKIFK